jgi:hypothetical protein
MKKKILFSILGVGLFAVAIMFNVQNLKNTAANAKDEINPECPNGCVAGEDGCYCYGWQQGLGEYKWEGDEQM